MIGKRVTMKDIAQKANVHQSTVSLALRNDPRLSEDTCKRIHDIAEELGYKPDPALRSLVAYRHMKHPRPTTQTIALILDLHSKELYAENESYVTLLQSVKEKAETLGYTVDVFWYGMDYHNAQSLNRVLNARGIQGIILGAFFHPETHIDIDWNDYSVVKINMLPSDVQVDAVLSNQTFSVRLAMQKIYKSGHHRIGLVINDLDDEQNLNMFTAGYFTTRRSLGIDRKDWIEPFIFSRKSKEELETEIYHWIIDNKITAFMSNWNNFSISAKKATEAGFPCTYVPLDMDQSTKNYRGINTHHHKIGTTSVEMLVNKLNAFQKGFSFPPVLSLVDPEWLEPGQTSSFIDDEEINNQAYQKIQ